MSDDIVKRLRAPDCNGRVGIQDAEAADEIARLRAELAAEREKVARQDLVLEDAGRRVIAHNAERKKLRDEVAKLREALERIAAIEDKAFGGDWDEIEEARTIARAVLSETKGDGDE